MKKKLSGRGGISVVILILLAAVIVLAVLVSIPYIKSEKESAAAVDCRTTLAEAQRRIDQDALMNGGKLSEEAARYAAVREVKDWSELCPGGGECYLFPDEKGSYRVVCALHTDDHQLRTRLNSARALDLLSEQLLPVFALKESIPDTVTVTVNSRELAVTHAPQEPAIKRGTHSMPDYEGTVAFFGDDGGKIVWFCYADEDYCAIWRDGEGWSGDSYAT